MKPSFIRDLILAVVPCLILIVVGAISGLFTIKSDLDVIKAEFRLNCAQVNQLSIDISGIRQELVMQGKVISAHTGTINGRNGSDIKEPNGRRK